MYHCRLHCLLMIALIVGPSCNPQIGANLKVGTANNGIGTTSLGDSATDGEGQLPTGHAENDMSADGVTVTRRNGNVECGIAYDKASNRIFAGCGKVSVVVDASTGKVVATIQNGTRVDALGWDPSTKLIYIPNGGEGNVTVVHQDSPDKYTTVATVATFAGAKTIAVDPKTHTAYLFQPERGPAPAPPAGTPPPASGGRGRGPQGPVIAAWFIAIRPQ